MKSRRVCLFVLTGMMAVALLLIVQSLAYAQQEDPPKLPIDIYGPPSATSGGLIVPFAEGGDAFGYTYVDSISDSVACPYISIDISGIGTSHAVTDDGEISVTLPFSFTFYGVASDKLVVGNNGGALFNTTTGDVWGANFPLPTGFGLGPAIFPFWDDLSAASGNLYTYISGTVGSRQFIVQWHGRPHYMVGGSNTATFLLILEEGTNNIKFQYVDATFGNSSYDYGEDATVGIQRNDTEALQYSYSTASLSDAMAICFTPPSTGQPRLYASYKEGPSIVVAGESISYTVVMSNSGDADATSTWLTDTIPVSTTYRGLTCSGGHGGTCGYNGGTNSIYWSGAISVGESVTVTLIVSPTADLACGSRIVNTATITDPDIVETVTVSRATYLYDALLFFSDFEANNGGFVAGSEWEYGAPTAAGGPSALSGSNVWGTDLDDTATDGTHHYLTKTIAIPAVTDARLVWFDWYADEGGDRRLVYVNGNEEWSTGLGVDQRYWQQKEVDISSYWGQTADILFDLWTTGGEPGPLGWYIDDFAIAQCYVSAGTDLSDLSGYALAEHEGPFNIWLGANVDTETTPDDDIDGTNDGVTRDPSSLWVPGNIVSLTVEISDTVDAARLVGWFDWNGDNTFDNSAPEKWVVQNVFSGTNTIPLMVPVGAGYSTGDPLNARFRLYRLGVVQAQEPTGKARDGEVEDYAWSFGPNAVTLSELKTDSSFALPVWTFVLVLLGAVGVNWYRRRQ